jgi:hypothetical protein
MGITVFSISHKLELKSLHDYELHYLSDGFGGYVLTPIDRDASFYLKSVGESDRGLQDEIGSDVEVEEGAGVV